MTDPHLKNDETTDCDLLSLFGQYFAQLLYAQRSVLELEDPHAFAGDEAETVLPSGTVLIDGTVKLYVRAAGLLVTCGFARQDQDKYVLLCASDRFGLDCPLTLHGPAQEKLGGALLLLCQIYEEYEKLGPPDILKGIFAALLVGGYTEKRFGHLEWSEKALEIVYPRRLAGKPFPEREALWKTDLFDWYLDEAAQQWPNVSPNT